MYVVINNQNETITEVLKKLFPGCIVDVEKEEVKIHTILYFWYTSNVMRLPDEMTMYELEEDD